MDTLKQIWQGLIYSSANPQKFALTLKAGVALLVLFGVDQTVGDMLVDNIGGFILSVVQTVSLAGLIWGGVRKVGITLNQKLNLGI